MRVAAIETSSEWCSVALAIDAEIRCLEVPALNAHGSRVLPLLEELLAEAELTLAGLDAIAFGAGPGAFTGLRVACSVAQGLAFARDLPVLGVSSLEAMAEAAGAQRVLTCVDARMREVYYAAYLREGDGGGWREALAPVCTAADAVPVPDGEGWLGAGNGFDAYGDALRERLAGALGLVRSTLRPSALEVARLALPQLAAGGGADPARAAPFYLRDKVALTIEERARR